MLGTWVTMHIEIVSLYLVFRFTQVRFIKHVETKPSEQAVLRVEKAAMQLLEPGILIKEYHQEVGQIMTNELIKLGLLDQSIVKNQDPEKPAYKKYFMHGTSHHLGLDTHDYGLVDQPLQANMVLTVEPGIYIPEEGFGIRIEDDVVTQDHGPPINLTENIPKEPDEIEHLMQQA